MKKTTFETPPFVVSNHIELSRVVAEEPVFCDTETDGLYGPIKLFQYYQEHFDAIRIVNNPDRKDMQEFLLGVKSVWHNSHYDLSLIFGDYEFKHPKDFPNFFDTFLASRLLYPKSKSHALDKLNKELFGVDVFKENGTSKIAMQKLANWSGYLSEEQYRYAATDVYCLQRLYNKVKQIEWDASYAVYLQDTHTVRCSILMQKNGMPVNKAKLRERKKELTKRYKEVKRFNLGVNENSYQQVRDYLQIDVSDKTTLNLMALKGNKEADYILIARKISKRLKFLDKLAMRKRFYGYFKPFAKSGRIISERENLQQIPRDLKDIFCYRKNENKVLIYSDYSQLELRTICAILKIEQMEQLFKNGEDIHAFVANYLFGPSYTEKDRFIAKTCNFSLLYGGMQAVYNILLNNGIEIDKDRFSQYMAKWDSLFPEIYRWHKNVLRDFHASVMRRTPLGRQYIGRSFTEHLNLQNQGAGAEVAKDAFLHLTDNMRNREHVKIINFIHDAFLLEAPDDEEIYMKAAEDLAHAMHIGWQGFIHSEEVKINDLPMPVVVSVGYDWGNIEKNPLHSYELQA